MTFFVMKVLLLVMKFLLSVMKGLLLVMKIIFFKKKILQSFSIIGYENLLSVMKWFYYWL